MSTTWELEESVIKGMNNFGKPYTHDYIWDRLSDREKLYWHRSDILVRVTTKRDSWTFYEIEQYIRWCDRDFLNKYRILL